MTRCILLAVVLYACTYPNPNIYTYGWRPPGPPDTAGRSFVGYDPDYEQRLIDRYVATHWGQVQTFRAENGF